MKTLFITLFCLLSLSAQAQFEVRNGTSGVKIAVGDQLTKAEMEARFGSPTTFDNYYDDDEYDAMVTDYKYPDASFYFVAGRLYGFYVKGADYTVCIENKYVLKVGDTILDAIRRLPPSEIKIENSGKILQLYIKDKTTGEFIRNSLVASYDSSKRITHFVWLPQR